MQDIAEEQTLLYQAAKKSYSRPATREGSSDAADSASSITVDFSRRGGERRRRSLDGAHGAARRALQALKTTTDQICDNLALIQRDDGHLLDQVVEISLLSDAVLALLSSTAWTVRGAWVGGTAYVVGDLVLQGGIVYVCMVAHTAGVFATDLAAGKWGQVTANATAATTSFAPTATIAAITVQAAIAELDNEVRPVQTILVRELFNGL
jgi:hypothetical protein